MFTPEQLANLQHHLLEFTQQALTEFLLAHPQETFSAFGYDCNVEYGEVVLCLNTQQGLVQALAHYQKHYPEYPELQTNLPYSFGDWLYQGFAVTTLVAEAELNTISAHLDFNNPTEYEKWEATLAQLMQVCRAALHDLQTTEVYLNMPKEPDFITLCLDHNESINHAA